MSDNSWLTMVALRSGVLPPLEDVFADVRRFAPQSLERSQVSEIRTSGRITTCRWGDSTVGVTLIDRPIPTSLLEGSCANAWYWPTAADEIKTHKAHLLINFVDESRDAVEAALRLTALSSSVARCTDALAIVWAPAGLIHQPRAFADQANESSRDSLPLYLWIDFRVRRQEDGRFDAFTTGLARFGKREIELAAVEASPQQVLEWTYNLAHYVLDRAAVVKDGDTVGLPDGTEFTVAHAASRIDDATDVLYLVRVEESG
jgi:hypothetical protein